jgi:hypothetical protein
LATSEDAPNFRIVLEKGERIVVQIVEDLPLPDYSEWWRDSAGRNERRGRVRPKTPTL